MWQNDARKAFLLVILNSNLLVFSQNVPPLQLRDDVKHSSWLVRRHPGRAGFPALVEAQCLETTHAVREILKIAPFFFPICFASCSCSQGKKEKKERSSTLPSLLLHTPKKELLPPIVNLNNHSSRRTGYDYNKSTYPFKLGPDHGDLGGEMAGRRRLAEAGQGA